MLQSYLSQIIKTYNKGDATEVSYYHILKKLIDEYSNSQKKKIEVTILPKKTEAGNPDFRIWDGKFRVVGYIEAKDFGKNLDNYENSEQLLRYRSTFPNVILTNFTEFRLYRNGERIDETRITRSIVAQKLKTEPPLENGKKLIELFDRFFSFSLPKIKTAKELALELAKRTRFLRDEVISIEIEEENLKGRKVIIGFYEAFKKYLIGTLTTKQFADLYSQTITYGLFAARTRANKDFNRELAFKYIPQTIGILRDVFRFISLEEPPKSLEVIVDDISEVLNVTDVNKILHGYFIDGKGKDPIVHFYETFLAAYDPEIRERRGVYYTPEPVVGYIVRAIHSILKTHFNLHDGFASSKVTVLDPAAGTLTFLAEAVKLAVKEFISKYGKGGKKKFIKSKILPNFYAFELMMAPYAIGHLKMSFLFDELGYRMSDDERFNLYLTNTLEMEELSQSEIPGLGSLSEESRLAGRVKRKKPILVIFGNPPYSGISANVNEWTEKLLKEDIDGTQGYYTVDGKPLRERNPKWLQDDYVKFLRFAQWKIQQAGYGIVGMITNHSYLDNPTFRGMRQSLMKTFNEIYIIDLHGNSLKKETTPDGGKDENVFDIRQGVAIALFVKIDGKKDCKVWHIDKYGLRQSKYNWLEKNEFNNRKYKKIKPDSPYYFFIKRKTAGLEKYLDWKKINEILPVNSVGIVTSRDHFVIDFVKNELINRILQFKNSAQTNEIFSQAYNLKEKSNWKISDARKEVEKLDDFERYICEILYRPFDKRHIFYHKSLIERMRNDVMYNMKYDNIGIITNRQIKIENIQHFWVSNKIVDLHVFETANASAYFYPLYIYNNQGENSSKRGANFMMVFEPKTEYSVREPNIDSDIYEKLETTFGKKPTPEEILYYIYGVFYSNIYRTKYSEFLKIDFPRVPFTKNYKIFKQISKHGNRLSDLHLLKSKSLNKPVSKYQGKGGNDKVEKVTYSKKQKRVYINKDKYFEGVRSEAWNSYVGGYQVCNKWLKDRKGRQLTLAEVEKYCKIITALQLTLRVQEEIDSIYNNIEKNILII